LGVKVKVIAASATSTPMEIKLRFFFENAIRNIVLLSFRIRGRMMNREAAFASST
jgi:hypothetical protein